MTQVVLSALLIASSSFPVPAFVTVDASAEDRGPILNEAHVEEITSDEPSKLDELVDNAREEKRKNEYAVWSTIPSATLYLLAPFTRETNRGC